MKLFRKLRLPLVLTLGLGMAAISGTALAVNLGNNDGLGDAGIFQYYTINEGWQTFFRVTNTSDQAVSVKIRFREAANSREVLDFIIFLSPYDVWTAWTDENATQNGKPGIRTMDTSCLYPLPGTNNTGEGWKTITRNLLGADFQDRAFASDDYYDNGNDHHTSLERMSEGHLEVIGIAQHSPQSSFGRAVKHNHGTGRPSNCSEAAFLFKRQTGGGEGQDLKNVLAMNGYVINVSLGQGGGFNPDILTDFTDESLVGDVLVTATDPDMDSANACCTNEDRTKQKGVAGNMPVTGGVDEVSYVLQRASVMNEWAASANPGSVVSDYYTQWVLSFPTKHYYVDLQNDAEPLDDVSPTLVDPSPGNDAYMPFYEEFDHAGGESCEYYRMRIWNREEARYQFTSPAPSFEVSLCNETNVIVFNDLYQDKGLKSSFSVTIPWQLLPVEPNGAAAERGWASMDFWASRGMSSFVKNRRWIWDRAGLPVTGWALSIFNTNDNATNHTTINAHKYTRAGKTGLVNLQILAINDYHGNIDTSSGSFGGTGGADFLATNIQTAEAGADHSIFVSAGDLIGASPLISGLFHDEPTIEAMNLIGLDINAVGDHEFDEGLEELLRMQNGGSHPVDGDFGGDPFLGADFEFLAANVVDDVTAETIFPPYTIRTYDGVRVAFIGLTLEGTPEITSPDGVAGLTFFDEVETVNALVPMLQTFGIESIVVLIHEGGRSEGGPNDCGSGLTGPIATIVPLLDDAVDLVIAGHTNDEFVCEIDGKWVTMADHMGRMFTDIDVTLDRVTRDMTIVAINNIPNLRPGVTPDPTVTALIDKYDALTEALVNTVIGTITTDLLRTPNLAGESSLGDIIADAQLVSTELPGYGDAVVAFVNSGSIRNDLFFASTGPEFDSEVTYEEAFFVQPFGNSLVVMSLTGAQIDTLLEQQWVGQTFARILQVSSGFSYVWDAGAANGSRVDPGSITINGMPLNLASTYRVTVNSFLADGGDNFPVLKDGTDRLGGETDLDALVTYFGLNSPVGPGPQDRITKIN